MIVELIAPADSRWRGVLESVKHDVYHLPGYGPLYDRDPRTQERALYVRGEHGTMLLPLLIRPLPELGSAELSGWRDATSPYGYPGPLVHGTFLPEEVEHLRARVFDTFAVERIATCFLRGHPLMVEGDPLLAQLGVVVVHGETAIIELTRSEDEIWKSYETANRRHIQRLRKLGYWARINEWADLAAFKALYRETMQRAGATAFYRFDDVYFDALRTLLGERLHLISVLTADGEVVSAALNTTCGGIVHGHLNGSSAAHRQVAPAKLIFDAGWRWAKAQGDHTLNLGGGLGGRDDSLMRFKRGFATATRPFRTVRVVCNEPVYQAACAAAGVSGEDRTDTFPAYRRTAVIPAPARTAA
jgi:hypothetical protein